MSDWMFPNTNQRNFLKKTAFNQRDCPFILEPNIYPDGVTAFPYKHGKYLVNTICDTFLFECAK